eukprot:scaffold5824_cov373-Prasinococcus_capsulatus_cf.AAC.3
MQRAAARRSARNNALRVTLVRRRARRGAPPPPALVAHAAAAAADDDDDAAAAAADDDDDAAADGVAPSRLAAAAAAAAAAGADVGRGARERRAERGHDAPQTSGLEERGRRACKPMSKPAMRPSSLGSLRRPAVPRTSSRPGSMGAAGPTRRATMCVASPFLGRTGGLRNLRAAACRQRLQAGPRTVPGPRRRAGSQEVRRRDALCLGAPREKSDADMLSLWDEMEEDEALIQELKRERREAGEELDGQDGLGRSSREEVAGEGRKRRVRRVGGSGAQQSSRANRRVASSRPSSAVEAATTSRGGAARREGGDAHSREGRSTEDLRTKEDTGAPLRPPLSRQMLTFEPTGEARRQEQEYDGNNQDEGNYSLRGEALDMGTPRYQQSRKSPRMLREGSRRIPAGSPIRRSFSEQLKAFMDDIDNAKARDEVDFYAKVTFAKLGLSKDALDALAEFLGHDKPSVIQSKAIPLLLKGESSLVADQTGSGKTLAYLVPLLEKLRKQEKSMLEGKMAKITDHDEQMRLLATLREPCKPRALILSPTQELSAQVLKVCRELGKGGLACRSFAITGNSGWKTQVKALEEGVDLVVGTPGRLLQHVLEGTLKVDNLIMVVMDECDVLLDDELKFDDPAVSELRARLPTGIQEVFVTATLPFEFGDWLNRKMPHLKKALGPGLHRTAPGLRELMIDCGGGGKLTEELIVERKLDALIELVNQEDEVGDSIMSDKTIIFCNKIQRCQIVENALVRNDRRGQVYRVLPYHSAIRPDLAAANLKQFMKPSLTKQVLVCTDRASRGIDSYQVDHVILFDWPRDPNEYIRRVGRTARAGGSGTVTALVAGSQVRQAKRVMAANRRGLPIHRLPAGAKGPKGHHHKKLNKKYASRRVNARANGRRRNQRPH